MRTRKCWFQPRGKCGSEVSYLENVREYRAAIMIYGKRVCGLKDGPEWVQTVHYRDHFDRLYSVRRNSHL